MILVAGTVRIKSVTRAEAIKLAVWMQHETRAEPGCLEYRFAEDLENPDTIHVFERWENLSALQAHFQTSHMARFNAQLPSYLAETPVITRYAISDSAAL
jgi:quinol monooxygenase YgiN